MLACFSIVLVTVGGIKRQFFEIKFFSVLLQIQIRKTNIFSGNGGLTTIRLSKEGEPIVNWFRTLSSTKNYDIFIRQFRIDYIFKI